MSRSQESPRRWRIYLKPTDLYHVDLDNLVKRLHPVEDGEKFFEMAYSAWRKIFEVSVGWFAAYLHERGAVPLLAPWMGLQAANGALKELVVQRFCANVVEGSVEPADKKSGRNYRYWEAFCQVIRGKAVVWRVGTTPERALAFDAKTVRRLVYPLYPSDVRERYMKETKEMKEGREVARVICNMLNRYKAYYRGSKEMGRNLAEWMTYCEALKDASQKP